MNHPSSSPDYPHRRRLFKTVDVFTSIPFLGNPVAVVVDAEGLTTEQMQQIAGWTNLSETTFVLPPTQSDADYRVRIFTPRSELPFAGHPTLGTAFALLEEGRISARRGQVVQECPSGLIPIAVANSESGTQVTLTMPAATTKQLSSADVEELEAILGHPVRRDPAPSIIDVGPVWLVAQVKDIPALLGLQPDFPRSALFETRLGVTGISLFAQQDESDDIEVRSFAPSCGVNEDPVCGSGNGAVAYYRLASGILGAEGGRYMARQGRCLGRDGQVVVNANQEAVKVGGTCVTCVSGWISA